MIPVSHMVHIVQAEREERLRRWQRTHPALPERTPGPGPLTRLVRALDPRLPVTGAAGPLPYPGDTSASPACC